MSFEMDLSDRTAIVTGGSRGIGRQLARSFADAGADVVVAARTESGIEDTLEEIRDYGVEGLAVPTDLRDPADIHQLVDETIENLGVPEILVNNAGVNLPAPLLDQSIEDVNAIIEVNLRGTFLLTQRVARELRTREVDSGRIINISSAGTHLGIPPMTVYSSTKSAIDGLTRGFAAELARDGVTVNSVSPGLTRNKRTEALIEEKDIHNVDGIPLERLAEPEEVGNLCVFLASDLAQYITGEDITMDGGVELTATLYTSLWE